MYSLEVLDFIADFNNGNVAGFEKTLTQERVQKRQEKTIPKPSFFKSTRDWGKSSHLEKSSGTKESTISKTRTCPICNGTGFDGHCYNVLDEDGLIRSKARALRPYFIPIDGVLL